MTHRVIVLAAGRGSRLGNGQDVPKPLRPIASVPLIVRILRSMQSEGVDDAVVVTGHRGDEIRRALEDEVSIPMRVRFVDNAEYDKKNGVSLLAARDYVTGDCLLTMADHLYSPEIIRRLKAFALPAGACALAIDHDIERCFDVDDATKVKLGWWLSGRGRIAQIGKELAEFDALDTGVFRIGPSLCEELAHIYRMHGDCSLSEGVAALARKGRMCACAIGDARWIDVDTPEAAHRAEAMLQVFGESLSDDASAGRPDPETDDRRVA